MTQRLDAALEFTVYLGGFFQIMCFYEVFAIIQIQAYLHICIKMHAYLHVYINKNIYIYTYAYR